MRLDGRWLAIAAVALLLVGFGRNFELPSLRGDGPVSGVVSDLGEDASRSRAFEIPANGELVFDLPSNTDQLRILTNAEMAEGELPSSEAVWRYSVTIDLVGWSGDEASREYHFKSRLTTMEKAEVLVDARSPSEALGGDQIVEVPTLDVRAVPRARYLLGGTQPLDGRLALIGIGELDFRPARLRLRLGELDRDLVGASVRVYFRDEIARAQRHAQWPRLSREEKRRKAGGNVYPPDLLTTAERDALVSHIWSPLAPTGVEGRDYNDRMLVQLRDRTALGKPKVVPRGVTLLPGLLAVVEVSARETLEIELKKAGAVGTSGLERATVRTVSLDGARSTPIAPRVADGAAKFTVAAEPGWLEIESPVESLVLVKTEAANRSVLSPTSLVAYSCDSGTPNSASRNSASRSSASLSSELGGSAGTGSGIHGSGPLDYRIVHTGDRPTPLRIDLRQVEPTAGAGPESIRFELLDRAGEMLSTGTLELSAEVSRHDWAEREKIKARVSERRSYYFELPSAVHRLRLLDCANSVVVTASNQPPDFVRRVTLPETGEPPQRRWFPLRPMAAAELAAAGRTRTLRMQPKPVTESAGGSDAEVRLRSHSPSTSSAGRYLLLRRAQGGSARPRPTGSASAYFRQLTDGDLERLTFAAGANRGPKLLFRRERTTPFELRVEVDGVEQIVEETVGRQGELSLEPLASGAHRIQVRGDGETRFFVNQVVEGAEFVRRWVPEAPSRPFEITVEKSGPMVLSGRVFQPESVVDGCAVETLVSTASRPAGQPLGDWTFARRAVSIGASALDRVAALGTDDLWMLRSEPFFVRLGTDLPDGRYVVRVDLRCSQPGFVSLSSFYAESTVEARRLFVTSDRSSLGTDGTGGRR